MNTRDAESRVRRRENDGTTRSVDGSFRSLRARVAIVLAMVLSVAGVVSFAFSSDERATLDPAPARAGAVRPHDSRDGWNRLRSPGVRGRASSTERETPQALDRFDGGAEETLLAAENGALREYHERWRSEPHDTEASDRARENVVAMLGDFDVTPESVGVSCGSTSCRALLSFEDTRSMANLARVPHDPRWLHLALPESREGRVELVVYWERDGDGQPF